jgi:hypothetical protein
LITESTFSDSESQQLHFLIDTLYAQNVQGIDDSQTILEVCQLASRHSDKSTAEIYNYVNQLCQEIIFFNIERRRQCHRQAITSTSRQSLSRPPSRRSERQRQILQHNQPLTYTEQQVALIHLLQTQYRANRVREAYQQELAARRNLQTTIIQQQTPNNMANNVERLAQILTPFIQQLQQNQGRQPERNNLPLPTFSGNGTDDPVTWFEEFDRCADANNMQSARKVTAVPAYLKGIAGHWYERERTADAAWPVTWRDNNNNSFKTRFMTQFRTNAQLIAWRQQLAIRIQGPSETVVQYADDIKTLLKKIDSTNAYPDDYKVREFTKGLNPSVAFFVNRENLATLDAAVDLAVQTEVGYNRTYNIANSYQMTSIPSVQNIGIPGMQLPTVNSSSEINTTIQELTKAIKQLTNNNRSSSWNNNSRDNTTRQNITCHYCGKQGHVQQDCYTKKNAEARQNNI